MKRPFTYVNMAMSADGKITSAAREYPNFTSLADRMMMERLRAQADAVLVGANTVRSDDPPLQLRTPEGRHMRETLGKPPGLLNVVVSAGGQIDPDARFFAEQGARGYVLATVEESPLDPRIDKLAQVWRLGRGHVDLVALSQRLYEHGVRQLLVEGGGEIHWGFIAANLIDEIHLTLCPTLLGGRTAPTILGGEGLAMAAQKRLKLLSVQQEDGELFLHYAVLQSGSPG